MKYKDELIRSMKFLAEDKRTIFIGQSVKFSGNAIFNTLESIDDSRKIETPVFEDVQMGISTGLSIAGFVPITCYPRFDFLILAMNQLVNHLDKIRYMSLNNFKPNKLKSLNSDSAALLTEKFCALSMALFFQIYFSLSGNLRNLTTFSAMSFSSFMSTMIP